MERVLRNAACAAAVRGLLNKKWIAGPVTHGAPRRSPWLLRHERVPPAPGCAPDRTARRTTPQQQHLTTRASGGGFSQPADISGEGGGAGQPVRASRRDGSPREGSALLPKQGTLSAIDTELHSITAENRTRHVRPRSRNPPRTPTVRLWLLLNTGAPAEHEQCQRSVETQSRQRNRAPASLSSAQPTAA